MAPSNWVTSDMRSSLGGRSRKGEHKEAAESYHGPRHCGWNHANGSFKSVHVDHFVQIQEKQAEGFAGAALGHGELRVPDQHRRRFGGSDDQLIDTQCRTPGARADLAG